MKATLSPNDKVKLFSDDKKEKKKEIGEEIWWNDEEHN